ncbi:unnamed protein product [Sphenostylis stenocarpa]|uniref:Disease resistance protein Roq1-like winged-helix domain-containing protein n=1 Tax=Sphenostylis stenocarpa TaxID=92480 RepID=A0AA86SRY2_9FABA|nr:unnamed protein product [Sphenostylis stenocarpa]
MREKEKESLTSYPHSLFFFPSSDASNFRGGMSSSTKKHDVFVSFREDTRSRVDETYDVQEWKKTESLELFCSEAFKKSYPERGYESLSDSAVKYAGGVPLALKVLEKDRDHVIRIPDACDFETTSLIEVLADKALLTISYGKIIQMHDLLQQMGLEIVCQECTVYPGRRSRLKDNEAREVIEENKDLSQIKNLRLHSDTLTKMKTLRFMKFYNSSGQSSSNTYIDLPATLEPFSDKLRYIDWIGYPYESLPSPFCAKFLVEIHMPHSKVKQLWQGIQELANLEGIDLSGCKQFEELPDLSKAPRLKWYLHPSVLYSDTLVTLILNGRTKLQGVKGERHLKSLEQISVNGCLSLEEFAVDREIQTLGASVRRKRNVMKLHVEGLRVSHTLKESSEPTNHPTSLPNLYELNLYRCNVKRFPENFDILENLRILSLEDCNEIRHLPNLPSSINYLGAINCSSLVSVSKQNGTALIDNSSMFWQPTNIQRSHHFNPLPKRLEELNEQVVETHDTGKFVSKYASLDLENCLQQLDENPCAILDFSNDVSTVLNEFRTLEITKEQEEGLEQFVELYSKAVNISQDKLLTEDEQAKLTSEKRDLYNKLQHSKLKVQQFDTTISTRKSQIEKLQERQREIQEATKKFQEKFEALEKERSTLESR